MRLVRRSTDKDHLDGLLAGTLRQDPGTLGIAWLGQAGFALFHEDLVAAVDPYLSDSLHEKYRDSRFPHRRMMAPPVGAAALSGADLLFSTHAHTDHLDPGTLNAVYGGPEEPRPLMICPRAAAATALERGVNPQRLISMNDGETHKGPNWEVSAVQSAHEGLDRDGFGNALFLGYVIRIGEFTIYHSGDCVPYPGLAGALGFMDVDVALLPVNGRDDRRRAGNIPGNFTAEEASGLAKDIGARFLIPHHFGMFDFNTSPPEEILRALRSSGRRIDDDTLMPDPGVVYTVSRT